MIAQVRREGSFIHDVGNCGRYRDGSSTHFMQLLYLLHVALGAELLEMKASQCRITMSRIWCPDDADSLLNALNDSKICQFPPLAPQTARAACTCRTGLWRWRSFHIYTLFSSPLCNDLVHELQSQDKKRRL